MIDRYYMSGPEEGDKIDLSVFVCDEDGTELIEIRKGTLNKRKAVARIIAKMMNEAEAEVCL